MFVLWLRPDQTVLSPAQDHRLLHGDLGVYSDLAGDGVVLAVTPLAGGVGIAGQDLSQLASTLRRGLITPLSLSSRCSGRC